MPKLSRRAPQHRIACSTALLLAAVIGGCEGARESRQDSAVASPSIVAGNCTLASSIPCPLPASFPDLDSARSVQFLSNDSWEDDAHSAHGQRSCGVGCKVMIVVAPETRARNLGAGQLASSGHFIGLVSNTDPNPAKVSTEFGIHGGETAFWLVRRIGGAAQSEFWTRRNGTWVQVGEATGYGQCDKDGTQSRSKADFDPQKTCPLKKPHASRSERTPATLTSWPAVRLTVPAPPAFDVPPLWITCKFGCCTVDIA